MATAASSSHGRGHGHPAARLIGVDARSLLCREPRGEGKSLLRLYQEMTAEHPHLRLVFFGDEHGAHYTGRLPAGSRVSLLGSRGARLDAWENIRLPFAAWRHGCDVLHCSSSSGPRWSATPVVLTVHDLIPMLLDDGQGAHEAARFQRRLGRGLASAASVIAVSENTRRDLARCFPGSAAKCRVIPWGRPQLPSSDRQRPRDAAAPPYVLAFGGTAHRKNTDYTLARFAAAAVDLPQLRLVIVGISSPAQRSHLQALAERLGVAERLRLPGFVDEDTLDGLLGGAQLLLYLSAYEGFGLPIVEAVGHGVPVVASNTSSIPEILGGDSAGGCHALDDLHGIEDDIRRMVVDPAGRAQRIAAQTLAVARFDWGCTARRTFALLNGAAVRRMSDDTQDCVLPTPPA